MTARTPGRCTQQSRILLVALAILLGFAMPVFAAQAKGAASTGKKAADSLSEPAGTLRSSIRAGRLAVLRWPNFSDYVTHVDNFYRPSGYALAWIRQSQPTSRAQEMIEVFLQADREGLNPDDYDGPRWAERVSQLKGPHSSQQEAEFDLALTVCAMRYISDVRIGRINPKHLKFGFDVQHKKLDLPSFLRQLLSTQSDVSSELAAIEPPSGATKPRVRLCSSTWSWPGKGMASSCRSQSGLSKAAGTTSTCPRSHSAFASWVTCRRTPFFRTK